MPQEQSKRFADLSQFVTSEAPTQTGYDTSYVNLNQVWTTPELEKITGYEQIPDEDVRLKREEVPENLAQILQPPGYYEAYIEGIGSGGFFIQPEMDISELSFGKKVARVGGNVTGMIGVHLGLNALFSLVGMPGAGTVGAATIGAATKGGKVVKGVQVASGKVTKGTQGYKAIQNAGKAYAKGNKLEAIASIGYGHMYGMAGKRIVAQKSTDKFFKLAAQDPQQALNYLKGTRRMREVGIWTTYGQIGTASTQLQSEEKFSFEKQLMAVPGDIMAGVMYTRGAWNKAKVSGDWYNRIIPGSGWHFGAGFMSSGLNGADASFEERMIAGALVTGMGGLMGGMDFQSTKNNVALALRRAEPDMDEFLVNHLSELAVRKSVKEVQNVPKFYEGHTIKNKKGYVAKIKQVSTDDKGRQMIHYDVYHQGGKKIKNENVTRTIDDFQKKWSTTPDDVKRITTNVSPNGKKKSWFKDDNSVKKFFESGRYGILSLDQSIYKQHLKIIPGETKSDALARELLARGYKESDIYIANNQGVKGYEQSFIVKNLRDKDAIELGKLTGQELVVTNKGTLELVRKNKNKPLELAEVILHSRVAGSTVTGKTVEGGKKMILGKKNTNAGQVNSPKRGRKGKIQRIQNSGNGIWTAANPTKFKGSNIYVVELKNGRRVAVGGEVAMGRVTRKSKVNKRILGETDLNKIRGAAKVKNIDEDAVSLHYQIRETELDYGMRKSDGSGAHRDLKFLFFSKRNTQALTKEESETWLSMLTGFDRPIRTGIEGIDAVSYTHLRAHET